MLKQETRNKRRQTFLILHYGIRSRITNILIERQQLGFVKVDSPGVLLDVVGIINSARQPAELTRFYRFQVPQTKFGGRSDVFKADALLPPPSFNTQDAGFVHFRTKYYWFLKYQSQSTNDHSVSPKSFCYNPLGNVFFTSDSIDPTHFS